MTEHKTCQICDHEGPDVQTYGREGDTTGMHSMDECEFCASTLAGTAHRYHALYSSDNRFTAQLIAELYWKLRETRATQESER